MSLDPLAAFTNLPGEFKRLYLEADHAFILEDYVTAKNLYQMLADQYSDFVDGWFGMTKTNLLLEDFEKCAKCYEFTLDVSPDFDLFPSIARLLRNRFKLATGFIKAMIDRGLPEEATRYISYCLDLNPNFKVNVELLELREAAKKKTQELNEIKEEEKRLKRKIENIKWGISIGILVFLLGFGAFWGYKFFRMSFAKNHYIKGQNYYRIAEEKYLVYEKYFQDLNDIEENLKKSQNEFSKSINIQPDFYLSHYMMGLSLMKTYDLEFMKGRRRVGFDLEKAKSLLQRARKAQHSTIRYKPDFPEGYLELAKVYYELVDMKNTSRYCQIAIDKAEKIYSKDNEKKDKVISQANNLIKRAKRRQKKMRR